MTRTRAFAARDLVALLATTVIAGSTAVVMARPGGIMIPAGLKNLQRISVATGQYRADNNDYFPVTYAYKPAATEPGVGTVGAWATWSAPRQELQRLLGRVRRRCLRHRGRGPTTQHICVIRTQVACPSTTRVAPRERTGASPGRSRVP